ncbi:unnamed protein product [Chrysodeixis includens]|uniref:Uncharacterized protein n=1 Tax=Chrysodeixis includens TaxID=689277 RepID=A0A9P0BZC6_CHRIL|nr:unnamed protein product [Chrysodeixis includens]
MDEERIRLLLEEDNNTDTDYEDATTFKPAQTTMNYADIKKLDEESAQKIKEGTGPSDKCICSLLSPPDGSRKGLGSSIKRAFASIAPGKKRRTLEPQRSLDLPIVYSKGGAGIYSTKEVVKRKTSCGKCGCDKENIVLKHSYANIRITSPDMSSICSCPSDCLPEKSRLMNNIKVTVEHMTLDPASEDSQSRPRAPREPRESERQSLASLIDAQYEAVRDLYDRQYDNTA